MAENQKNPFDILNGTAEKTITVKALKNAKVKIKTALTVAQEQEITQVRFRNQELTGTQVIPNQADATYARIKTVSMILIEPTMTEHELGELVSGDDAINEIYNTYVSLQDDKKGN